MSLPGEHVSKRNPRAVDSALEQLGNTPLLRFVNIEEIRDMQGYQCDDVTQAFASVPVEAV
jgi:hypothetical protein